MPIQFQSQMNGVASLSVQAGRQPNEGAEEQKTCKRQQYVWKMKKWKKNPIETLNESHALRTSYVCDLYFFFYIHLIRKVLLLKSCCSCCLVLAVVIFVRVWRVCAATATTTLLNALFNCTINFCVWMTIYICVFLSFSFFICVIRLVSVQSFSELSDHCDPHSIAFIYV